MAHSMLLRYTTAGNGGAEYGTQHPVVRLCAFMLEGLRRKALALNMPQPQTARFEAKT